jgi:hypothetical protein
MFFSLTKYSLIMFFFSHIIQSHGQAKDYEIGICCFSAKHAALRRKSKDWLARNQNNVSEWSNMSASGLFFLFIHIKCH